jgi:FixJ family two-component response regulator
MTQHHIPADLNVQQRCCENHKSHITEKLQKEFCIRTKQALRFNINNLVYV